MSKVVSRKILIVLSCIVLLICLMSFYGVIAKCTNVIQDVVLNNWVNIHPICTLASGLVSLAILLLSLKYNSFLFEFINLSKTIRIAVLISIPFGILGTVAWFHGYNDPDVYELGDVIWQLGSPLTFLIIELPIYIKQRFECLNFFSYLWMYPIVLILFVVQWSIYIHGIRLVLNVRKLLEFRKENVVL